MMTEPVISVHAIERYRQRVEDVPPLEVVRRLNTPALRAAVDIGAESVKLPGGYRLVIVGDTVVTVRPRCEKQRSDRGGQKRIGRRPPYRGDELDG